MTHVEVLLGIGGAIVGALVTGGLGWWARYVTSGAAKAHRLADTVQAIQRSIEQHEEREERKFETVEAEVTGLREIVGELVGSVAELHGKVDSLSLFLRNGGRPKG